MLANHNRFVIISAAFFQMQIFFFGMETRNRKNVGEKKNMIRDVLENKDEEGEEKKKYAYIYIYINMVTRTYWVVRDTHHVMHSNKERKKKGKRKSSPFFQEKILRQSVRSESDIYIWLAIALYYFEYLVSFFFPLG